jgi:hypothetical protein
MKGPITLLALVGMAACAPLPRSPSYFEDHPDEAAKVVAACRAETVQGGECASAQAGVAAAARDARMAAERKAF